MSHVQVKGDHAGSFHTNLFKEFLLKIVLSQFKRLNVIVSEGSIVQVW